MSGPSCPVNVFRLQMFLVLGVVILASVLCPFLIPGHCARNIEIYAYED